MPVIIKEKPVSETVKEATNEPAQLKALTSLRFAAAMTVVLGHADLNVNLPVILDVPAHLASAGVSFFFLLSGFILTFNYYERFQAGTQPIGKFYRARFARIFPMHVFSLLLITPLLLYAVLNGKLAGFGIQPEHLNTSDLVLNWLGCLTLFSSVIPSWPFGGNFNPPAWSLGCEVVFYLCFPLIVRFLLPFLGRVRVGFLTMLIALVIVLQAGIWFWAILDIYAGLSPAEQLTKQTGATYGSPLLRLFEFVAGCMLGLLYLKRPKRLLFRNTLLALVLGLIWLITAYPTPEGLPGYLLVNGRLYIFYVPLFALIIFLVATGGTFINQVLERPLPVMLGEASYSLYLIHWAMLLGASALIDILPGVNAAFAVYGTVVLAIVVSVMLYQLVEVPWRRRLR